MERAERNGLSLQSQKGSTGLLFSVRILAPILDGGLRHIVLAAIQYSLGRHTYMPGIVAEFTCRNLRRLDEATRSAAVAEISAHLNRYGEQEPYPRVWYSLSRTLTSGKIKEDDRRKKRMPILQPLESMERISRQALADDLDTVLERISRENIGLVITEEGKDDLVLCPASWFNLVGGCRRSGAGTEPADSAPQAAAGLEGAPGAVPAAAGRVAEGSFGRRGNAPWMKSDMSSWKSK